ncbi:MAG: hypothetical protein CM15mV122_240 [uncultured marine virus]|nr:MAG: hypothetical protein CM15mV122_240 [uncultured marine virus]
MRLPKHTKKKKHPQGHYYANQPIPPMASDSGWVVWYNRADDFFLIIHRYTSTTKRIGYTQTYIQLKLKTKELGYKPTPIDDPVKFRSILNNVGFEIDGKNLVTYNTKEQTGFTILRTTLREDCREAMIGTKSCYILRVQSHSRRYCTKRCTYAYTLTSLRV